MSNAPMPVEAPVWDTRREALHVRDAVLGAALRNGPAPHLYVENVFSPAMYEAMLALFPTGEALETWNVNGASGNYDRRRDIRIPDDAERLAPDRRTFWLDAAAMLIGDSEFARALLQRFEPYARARFGDRIDDPAFARDQMRRAVLLNEHDPGYFLGPHTDRRERVITCLFYFPEHAGLDHLGTTLYRPREPGFTCDGGRHHDPAGFEPRETIPYRPNSAFIFVRSDVMFHGVEPLTAEQLRGSRRRSMQLMFFVQDERPRETCKTTVRAGVPSEMRAGAAETIAIELTNRGSVTLETGFAQPLQLGYRWFDRDGRDAEPHDGVRTALPGEVAPGETARAAVRVLAPQVPGRYVLRLSVVQEGVAWFDDIDPSNGAQHDVFVFDASGACAPATATIAQVPHDVLTPSDGVMLGDGWSPPERAANTVFRRAGDGAVVHVATLRPVRHVLRLVVGPAPGMESAGVRLSAHLEDGRELGAATVSERRMVTFALPPESPRVFSVTLRATGLRVFAVSVERTADVLPAWAVPARGFYPLERYAADVFRWVGAEATIGLHRSRGDVLEFDAESGPGMGSRPFRLHVAGPDGVDLAMTEVGTRTRVSVPLRDARAFDELLLRGDGGGIMVADDPRTLNFRVFPIGA